MAHEIKNSMVAIKTFVDLLAQKGQDTELTEVVGRELERINAIVTQMLRFAAPNRAAFTTMRIHDVLDHSLRLMQHQVSGKLISLQRHYQAEPDTVRGDDAQLQQVFMNLLRRATRTIPARCAAACSSSPSPLCSRSRSPPHPRAPRDGPWRTRGAWPPMRPPR